jgi:hypothetical protein
MTPSSSVRAPGDRRAAGTTLAPRSARPRPSLRTCAAAFLALAFAACATTPPAQWDGLRLQRSAALDQVYLRPGATFAGYRRVRLEPAEVSFDKAWNPNAAERDLTRQVTPKDAQAMKDALSKMLHETFAAELQKGGYTLTDDVAPDVLRVTPSIVDLYVNAPDVPGAGRVQTYVMDAGRMTLVVEARDAVTGQLLARVVDTKRGTDWGRLTWANAVTNAAEAQRAITAWAKALRAGLDRVGGRGAASASG